MSLYNGPPRGGSRGGRDQFNWEAVKADKDRECYLGHSVKALTGRWQKGKDVYWYTREKGDGSQVDEELRQVKEREAQLMAEATGPVFAEERCLQADALDGSIALAIRSRLACRSRTSAQNLSVLFKPLTAPSSTFTRVLQSVPSVEEHS